MSNVLAGSFKWPLAVLAAALALSGCGGGGEQVEAACIDEDADGFGAGCELGPDCDDSDPKVKPIATEICNGIDDNCDGRIDEAACQKCVDADGDGFGAGCAAGADCNDSDSSVNPSAAEVCDQKDNNCDGRIDEGGVCTCQDGDGDGYGNGCTRGGDCDDANPNVHPGAAETCNQKDDNCNNQIDEGGVCDTSCTDVDGDGYGDGCSAGPDCEETDAAINPGANETCDGKDNNCDGQVDEGGVCQPGCTDEDGDGYGEGCALGSDCDDTDASTNPGAVELCDKKDNNCNGAVDEGEQCAACVDGDGDGHYAVHASCPGGDDCDDAEREVRPGGVENPRNGRDDNCDGRVDEKIASPLQGAIVINEVLSDGTTSQDANGDGEIDSMEDEFVELVNASSQAVDMTGWTLWDRDRATARHTFPVTIVQPGKAVVVFGGGTAPASNSSAQFMVAQNNDTGLLQGLSLNNDGDVLTLYDDQMREVAVLAYGSAGTIAAVQDASLTRSPDVTGIFMSHVQASGSQTNIFSPGKKVNGASF
ncbi:MAG: MopE-related protein [Myxococcales bacterium]|jgi:hypothetical protein